MRLLSKIKSRIIRAIILFLFPLLITTLVYLYKTLSGIEQTLSDFMMVYLVIFIITALIAVMLTMLLVFYKRYGR